MFSVRNILFATLGMYLIGTQLQMISGGCLDRLFKRDNKRNKEEPLLTDGAINLSEIKKEGNQIKYYKYVMIVYCRTVESKMEISREEILDLDELEEFKISKWTSQTFNEGYAELIGIALKVLVDYHTAIVNLNKQNSLSYVQTAFYFRVLEWLKFEMKIEKDENNSDYTRLTETLKNYQQRDVAKNYLPEIVPPEYFQRESEKLNRSRINIQDLRIIALYEDAAMDLFLKIKSEGFESAELVQKEYIAQYAYESILENVVTESFIEKFNLEPFMMLMYADYVFYYTIKEKSRIGKENFFREEKISDMTKSIMGWRYVLTCFHRNVQRLFSEYVKMDETNIKLLEHLSDHYEAHYLRLQCISFLYWEIIPVIDKQMKNIHYSTTRLQIDRVFYARILAWMNQELSDEKYMNWAMEILGSDDDPEKTELLESLVKIISLVKKMTERENRKNYIIQLFSLDLMENIGTIDVVDEIENLENYGRKEGQVLDLFFNFAHFEEITNFAKLGLDWDLEHRVIYEKMLQATNPEDFAKKFGMKPFQMLMRMDYALYSQNHGLYESQEITLKSCDVQHITEGTLKRWKYAMIFFIRAVEMNLLENETIDSINTKLLVYLSDEDTSRKLRLSCIAFLCVHILAEIDERIQDKGVHLGGDTTQETYHEGIFELIYPEFTGNGSEKWPSKEQRDLGIDSEFRDFLNKIRAIRMAVKNSWWRKSDVFGDLIKDLEQRIESTLKPLHPTKTNDENSIPILHTDFQAKAMQSHPQKTNVVYAEQDAQLQSTQKFEVNSGSSQLEPDDQKPHENSQAWDFLNYVFVELPLAGLKTILPVGASNFLGIS